MYDLIVIGGGPAGLTAAIYAIRKRLKVLLVSKNLGGKTNFHLELPDMESHMVVRGAEVVDKFKRELEYLRFAHHLEGATKVEKSDDGFVVHTDGDGELEAKALIIATGTRQHLLDVPGEREYLSKGLCYSALSYAPLFIEKDTVVIGPGELALRAAAELATVAHKVTVVGPSGEALQTPLGQKLSRSGNVKILPDYKVTKVMGNGFCSKVRVAGPNGESRLLEADGTFIEMGLTPMSQMVADLVDLDANGFIKVDNHGQTSQAGIFAAGDVTDSFAEQVLVAIGDGAKAALSAFDYLLPTL